MKVAKAILPVAERVQLNHRAVSLDGRVYFALLALSILWITIGLAGLMFGQAELSVEIYVSLTEFEVSVERKKPTE